MPNLGALYYTMGIKDLTDADLQKINAKLKNLGSDITLTPKILKDITQAAIPKGVKIELDPTIRNEAIAKAVEGKVLNIHVKPLVSDLRSSLREATKENPPKMEVGVYEDKLRALIERILNRRGYTLNIATVNDNYSKTIQTQLDSRRYTAKITVDATELARTVDKAITNVTTRNLDLRVMRNALHRSIEDALSGKKFDIEIRVLHNQARKAVQNALSGSSNISNADALRAQRLATAEAKLAAAELNRVKAANHAAGDAAKSHADANRELSSAMSGNIDIAGKLGNALSAAFSVQAAREFLSQIIEIGGELEHQKIAMDTIFGDKGKTAELFGQIKGLARTSPFGVMELTASVKQLSAYGVEYNEIYDTAKRLADISAATSVDINRLILAFGKTKSRGFLDGLEAKQFAYANIPIYEMVRKKLEEIEGQAVTTAEVMARMKKREIGFDIVKDVLWDITDDGGKFHDMQGALAGSVKTSWKLVRDNIELMFGEMAEGSLGSGLKGVAEILQGLTREWRTLGDIIGVGGAAFGIARVATLALNKAIDAGTASTYSNLMAQKRTDAQRLQSIATVRALTAEEKTRVATAGRLTAADLKTLVAEKKLTDEELRMLYVRGNLKRATIEQAVAQGTLTREQAKSIAGATRWKGVILKMKAGVASLGQTIRGFGASLVGFLTNPATLAFAAIGAVTAAISKYKDEVRKAEETGDNIFTKAEEGARNLRQSLTEIRPAEGLTELQLTQGIEQMQQAIKDYSPKAIEDINDSLVSQDGHVNTLVERYEALRGKIEGLAESYDTIKSNRYDEAVANSLKDTTEFLGDSLEENMKDYESAISTLKSHIRSYASEHKQELSDIVSSAEAQSEAFRDAVKGMGSDYEKFEELIMSGGKYRTEMDRTIQAVISRATAGSVWTDVREGIFNNHDLRGAGQRMNAAYAEMMKDAEKFTASFLLQVGKTKEEIARLPEAQKDAISISLRSMLDNLSGVGDATKMIIAKMLEENIGVKIIEDKVGPALKEALVKAANSATDASVIAAVNKWKHEGLDRLSEAERQIIWNLTQDAKETVLRETDITTKEMQDYLSSHTLKQTIELSYSEIKSSEFQQEIWKSSPNLQNLLSEQNDKKAGERGYGGLSDAAKIRKHLYDKWTRGSKGDYETKNRIKSDLEALYNEYIAIPKSRSDDYRKQKKAEFDRAKELADAMGFGDIDIRKLKSNKEGGSKKDELADSMRQRFKDIKDAWSEFQKWSKTEGSEAAAARVGDSGLFSTLSSEEIPRTVEQYRFLVERLESELRAAGVSGTARENLLNELVKQLLSIDKTVVDERLKTALDTVSKEAERQLSNWNLYDKLSKATGKRNLAANIAFGFDTEAETDYPSLIKQQLANLSKAAEDELSKASAKDGTSQYTAQDYTFDSLKALYEGRDGEGGLDKWMSVPEEIRKAWESANSDILRYYDQQREAVASILTEYQSLRDSVDAINAKRENDLKIINGKDSDGKFLISDEKERQAKSDAVNAKADYDIFAKSDEYLRFFNDIYGLTLTEANRIGDLIQLNLNKRLQSGLITIHDYEKEMEKVREQLEAIRNVKSNAMAFMTGGVTALNDKRLAKEEGVLANNDGYKAALAKQIKLQKQLTEAQAEGSAERIAQIEAEISKNDAEIKSFTKIRDAIIKSQEAWQDTLDIANIASNIAQGLSDAYNSIKDMAAAFGADTESGAWLDVGGIIDSVVAVTGGVQKVIQSAMSGDIGGVIAGAVSTITTPFTIWADIHDKKLDKMIEKSREYSERLQHINDAIERRMDSYLGNAKFMGVESAEKDKQALAYLNQAASRNWMVARATQGTREKLSKRTQAYEDGGAYGYQREIMSQQLAELEKQKKAEQDKKKTDSNAVAQYNAQIDELRVKILQFAEETANSLYGIDLKGWASQLGDSLVNAFARGEDAAAAFDSTVGDIMRSVASKLISVSIIEPMFEDLREYLFGKDGQSGAFGKDFELDAREVGQMGTMLLGMKEKIGLSQELYDKINEQLGGILDETADKSGLSAGIQSITEDTADLLASYVNAIRAYVASIAEGRIESSEHLRSIALDALPRLGTLAESQLRVQEQIATNTQANAIAAQSIYELLRRNTMGGNKFNI